MSENTIQRFSRPFWVLLNSFTEQQTDKAPFNIQFFGALVTPEENFVNSHDDERTRLAKLASQSATVENGS